jgi:hypothetical protein
VANTTGTNDTFSYTPATGIWTWASGCCQAFTLGANGTNQFANSFSSAGGFWTGSGYNYAPYSNLLTAGTWFDAESSGAITVNCTSFTDDFGDPACQLTGTATGGNYFWWTDDITHGSFGGTPLAANTTYSQQIRAKLVSGGPTIDMGGDAIFSPPITLTSSWANYCVVFTTPASNPALDRVAAIFGQSIVLQVSNVTTTLGNICPITPVPTTNNQVLTATPITYASSVRTNAVIYQGNAVGAAGGLPGPLNSGGQVPIAQTCGGTAASGKYCDGGSGNWTALPSTAGFTAAGDLTGSTTTQEVVGLRSISVPAPTTGCLYYNSGVYTWNACSGGSGTVTTTGSPASGNPAVFSGATSIRPATSSDAWPGPSASTTGNAATATALAATPSVCTGGEVVTAVSANGTPTCTGNPAALVVGHGSLTLATTALAAGTCQAVTAGSVNSVALAGAASGDRVPWSTTGSVISQGFGPTGGLAIVDVYATAGYINADVCNFNTTTQTPGTVTIKFTDFGS